MTLPYFLKDFSPPFLTDPALPGRNPTWAPALASTVRMSLAGTPELAVKKSAATWVPGLAGMDHACWAPGPEATLISAEEPAPTWMPDSAIAICRSGIAILDESIHVDADSCVATTLNLSLSIRKRNLKRSMHAGVRAVGGAKRPVSWAPNRPVPLVRAGHGPGPVHRPVCGLPKVAALKLVALDT